MLNADPLADVSAWRDIAWVMRGGKAWRPADLVPPNPAAVVQAQVEAYNARDVDAFVQTYAEDIVIERWDGTSVAEGAEALRATYTELFEASESLECTVLTRTVSGHHVVDHELVTGLRGGPPVRAVAVYEVSGGLIQRVRFLPKE